MGFKKRSRPSFIGPIWKPPPAVKIPRVKITLKKPTTTVHEDAAKVFTVLGENYYRKTKKGGPVTSSRELQRLCDINGLQVSEAISHLVATKDCISLHPPSSYSIRRGFEPRAKSPISSVSSDELSSDWKVPPTVHYWPDGPPEDHMTRAIRSTTLWCGHRVGTFSFDDSSISYYWSKDSEKVTCRTCLRKIRKKLMQEDGKLRIGIVEVT